MHSICLTLTFGHCSGTLISVICQAGRSRGCLCRPAWPAPHRARSGRALLASFQPLLEGLGVCRPARRRRDAPDHPGRAAQGVTDRRSAEPRRCGETHCTAMPTGVHSRTMAASAAEEFVGVLQVSKPSSTAESKTALVQFVLAIAL